MYFVKKNTYLVNIGLRIKQSVKIEVVTIQQSFVQNQIEYFFYNTHLEIMLNSLITIVGI